MLQVQVWGFGNTRADALNAIWLNSSQSSSLFDRPWDGIVRIRIVGSVAMDWVGTIQQLESSFAVTP